MFFSFIFILINLLFSLTLSDVNVLLNIWFLCFTMRYFKNTFHWNDKSPSLFLKPHWGRNHIYLGQNFGREEAWESGIEGCDPTQIICQIRGLKYVCVCVWFKDMLRACYNQCFKVIYSCSFGLHSMHLQKEASSWS